MTSVASMVLVAVEVTPGQLAKVCGENPATECRKVLEWTGNEFLAHVADNFVAPLLQIVIIWAVAVVVNKVIRRFIKRVGRHLEGAAESGRFARMKAHTPRMLMETGSVSIRAAARAKTTTTVLRSVSSVVVYSIALLYTFSVLGLRLGPLFAGAGIVGVALGFGAQSMVKDFLGGMFMLVEDQFGVGDVIDVAAAVDGSPGVTGTVEEVTLRVTSIRDSKGTIWHIPNGDIRRVGNMSQGWARALLDVPVPYGTDLVEATALIDATARRVAAMPEYAPEILSEPHVWGVEDLGPDAVIIRLVIKTRPGEQWPIARALRAALHDAFVAAGIDRPFAQHDIYLHDGPIDGVQATHRTGRVPQGVVGHGEDLSERGGLGDGFDDSGRITSLDDLGP